jgi:predicted nucleic acid-binding protein
VAAKTKSIRAVILERYATGPKSTGSPLERARAARRVMQTGIKADAQITKAMYRRRNG